MPPVREALSEEMVSAGPPPQESFEVENIVEPSPSGPRAVLPGPHLRFRGCGARTTRVRSATFLAIERRSRYRRDERHPPARGGTRGVRMNADRTTALRLSGRSRIGYRCSDCGYGIAVAGPAPACPMCGAHEWEAEPWRPFSQRIADLTARRPEASP
jgi:hypothetical protein